MFKPKILTRFLMGRFFAGVGTVMLIVCGIIFAITFVERLPSNPTPSAAIIEAWVRLLEYVPLFLPLAVFMGTLFASYKLTKSTENIIVASAGLSPYQSAKPFLISAALIGIIATTIINPYSVNLSAKNITAENLKLIDDAIWLRESSENGTITLRAKDVRVKNNTLIFQDAIVFKQSIDSKLQESIEAGEIKLSYNGLETQDAKIWDINGIKTNSPWHVNTLLNPKTVLDRYLQPDQISFWNLPEFIKKMEKIGASVRGHLVQLWILLFLPLTMISMAALGVAFSQTRQRRNYSFGIKFGTGIIACFALYFITNMFNALGATGALPTLLAVIAPPVIIIALAGVFIASFDAI
ncbi:MAG: LptF/LptG family permease [Alphaproteobacteria bacterium]|nr:LptF/LptG family permease [Alphaproteobacteria bacterium]MBN2675586.1 LptF/LptG family permease [Alphaproteobacteria bacterium]